MQSLATVSGRMLASTVFEDEEVLAYDKQVSVVRIPAGDLVGCTLVDERARTRTGGTVVAVVRGEETITDFDPETFAFEADDEVVIAGTDHGVRADVRRVNAGERGIDRPCRPGNTDETWCHHCQGTYISVEPHGDVRRRPRRRSPAVPIDTTHARNRRDTTSKRAQWNGGELT